MRQFEAGESWRWRGRDYCLAERPQLRVRSVAPDLMLRFARDEDHERIVTLLRKAGLPD
jgi:hypothetical protein